MKFTADEVGLRYGTSVSIFFTRGCAYRSGGHTFSTRPRSIRRCKILLSIKIGANTSTGLKASCNVHGVSERGSRKTAEVCRKLTSTVTPCQFASPADPCASPSGVPPLVDPSAVYRLGGGSIISNFFIPKRLLRKTGSRYGVSPLSKARAQGKRLTK